MATRKERKNAELIKKVDTVYWADREARGKLEDQIEGPFASGLFTFNDSQSAVNAALAEYQTGVTELNDILSYHHPAVKLSDELVATYKAQAAHYSEMIDLLK